MRIITQNLSDCEKCGVCKMTLLGELETTVLDKVMKLRSSQYIYSPGEYLYHAGETPDRALTIHKGWVILFKDLDDGSRQILRFALAGDLLSYRIGLKNTLDHSAIAVSDVTVCSFPIESFRQEKSILPDLSFAISSISELMTAQCYATFTSIAKESGEAKVAFLLLSLFLRESEHSLKKKDINEGIFFPITQEDIADALGLTSIHVNRIYQGLRKQGLIECKSKHLRVIDQNKLAKVAHAKLPELKKLMIVS